ncbi:MAG: Rne/Rng family ribonuclease [Vicingaceae bacterium]
MSVDLLINSTPKEVVIAVLKDKRLVELHSEKKDSNFSVGDIYLGRVKKVMPGLNAAFVDVGYKKDAFLHYLDLGPQFASLKKFADNTMKGKQAVPNLLYFNLEADIDKGGKMPDLLSGNQQVVVQITKEPISTKGPRLTSELSLAGRYLVLVPFSERISVSQKIGSRAEKDRLKRLITSIKPKGFGVIVRTVAEGKKVADLHNDLNSLVARWDQMHAELKSGNPPRKLLGELNRTSSLLRDLMNPSFSNIHINDEGLFHDAREFLTSIAPEKKDIVTHYDKQQPLFDYYGVEKQIKASFGRNVSMKSGAYLVIDHTEALHVIDVNSGQRGKTESNQEENALDVNLEAAEEIARQLRLRDMGGIIVIDFIDMRDSKNRKVLFDKMKEAMRDDRAKHSILPPSKFGLIQITRQRVRPEMDISTAEKCPSCAGTGEVQASILIEDEIDRKLKIIADSLDDKIIQVHVHPYLEAYFNKGWNSIRKQWQKKIKRKIKVLPMTSLAFLEYRFFDDVGVEIEV